jgi:hypothetical protein
MVDRFPPDGGCAQVARVQLAHKNYGDKVAAELSGPDGGPIQRNPPDKAPIILSGTTRYSAISLSS